LNEPTLFEAARVFAQRILKEGGAEDIDRIRFAFQTSLGRAPTPDEQSRLLTFVRQQKSAYQRDPQAAGRLIQVGSAPGLETVVPQDLAPWVMLANVLFNLDEALTKG
jgi:hypothetical protein